MVRLQARQACVRSRGQLVIVGCSSEGDSSKLSKQVAVCCGGEGGWGHAAEAGRQRDAATD